MLVHFVLYHLCCIPCLLSNIKNLLSGEREIPEERLKESERTSSCNQTVAVICNFLIRRQIQSIVKNTAIDLLAEDPLESTEIITLFSSAALSTV